MKTDDMIWILVIEDKYGFCHYAHRTYGGLTDTLYNWAAQYWDEDIEYDDLGEIPDDKWEAINLYFQDHEVEFYTIEEVPLDD